MRQGPDVTRGIPTQFCLDSVRCRIAVSPKGRNSLRLINERKVGTWGKEKVTARRT